MTANEPANEPANEQELAESLRLWRAEIEAANQPRDENCGPLTAGGWLCRPWNCTLDLTTWRECPVRGR